MLSLLKNLEVFRVLAPTVAGTTTIVTSSVDCAGLQTVLFIVGVGTITSGGSFVPTFEGSDDDVSFSPLAASGVNVLDGADDKLLLIEIVKPRQRYIRLSLDRNTANVVFDLGIAIGGVWHRNLPVTQPTASVTSYGNVSQISPAVA